jgi:hypothetical protein
MATDQEIRDAGFKYIPQQQYLLNPFKIPVAPEAPVINQGIVNTNAFAGGGNDGFSVYNADPNTITNMNPNMYALQDARRNNELSYVGKNLMEPSDPNPLYSTNTAAMKHMEMYPEQYGLDKPPPSKAAELLSKGINLIPGMGLVKTGTAFLGDFANQFLPINRRAIMENQLGTQGVMINDIGQIVVGQGGQYNTPQGIMAGYNANKMTDETFTNRQKVMRDTLTNKYGLSKTQIDGLIGGSLSEEEMEEINEKAFNKTLNRPSDLISKIRNVEIARKNFGKATDATDTIFDIKTDTKTNNQDDGGGPTYIGGGASLQDAGGTYDGGMHSAEGGFENTGPAGVDAGTADVQDYADIYANGGRVGLRYGGLLSIL